MRISALVGTRGATHRADFWARVQGANSPGDGLGLGGQQVLIAPSSPWTRYEIVMDVDPAGVWLQYAVGVAGPGELWLDAAKVEIVGNDVPVTNGSSRRTSK